MVSLGGPSTLGFLTGLGFGVVEFIIYVLLFRAAIPFRVVAIVFHEATASLTAYGIWRGQPFRYYMLAVTLHRRTTSPRSSGTGGTLEAWAASP